MPSDSTRAWTQGALLTVLSVALFHLSVLGLLFLLPLEGIRARWGVRAFGLAAMAAAAGIAVLGAVLDGARAPTVLSSLSVGLPLVLIAGWVAIVLMERTGWRLLYRLLLVTAVTGLVVFPTLWGLWNDAAFGRALQKGFEQIWDRVFLTPGLDRPGLKEQLNPNEFFELLKQVFLGSFLLAFFLVWALTGRASQSFRFPSEPKTLKTFSLPPQGAALLLGVWGLILAQSLLARSGVVWNFGFAQYALWNVAWITLLVYGLAGWGIVGCLMDRWRWPPFAQAAARGAMVLFLVLPGTGQVVVLVGLPLLAVLELWIDLRKTTQGVEV